MQPSKLDMWKGLGLDNDNCNSISLSRVWTDFWIQNSRFFQTFSKTITSFSRLTSNRWAKETLRKEQEQSFINDTLQTYRQDWKWFDQQEKNFTCKALVVALKKHFTIFSRLYLYFPDFFQVENCRANFKTFSRIQDSVQL